MSAGERDSTPDEVRVGVIGYGAIGRVVASALSDGRVGSAVLVGVAAQHEIGDSPVPQFDVGELVSQSDLIIEAAGHQAVVDHALEIVEAGRDLVLLSLGALADDELAARIADAGPGRAVVCTGAVGGLDLMRAAARMGELSSVELTTSKRPAVLAQPWMDADVIARLEAGREHIVVFDGTARQAASRFPKSINVAATLALALGSWDLVRVRVIADPDARLTRHVIDATGDAGTYRFDISNRPSPLNPATSGIVPHAVLQTIADLCDGPMRLRSARAT